MTALLKQNILIEATESQSEDVSTSNNLGLSNSQTQSVESHNVVANPGHPDFGPGNKIIMFVCIFHF